MANLEEVSPYKADSMPKLKWKVEAREITEAEMAALFNAGDTKVWDYKHGAGIEERNGKYGIGWFCILSIIKDGAPKSPDLLDDGYWQFERDWTEAVSCSGFKPFAEG